MPSAVSPAGPIERTAIEQEQLRRLAVFRREREDRSRRLLHESDVLLDLIEECRVRRYRLLPSPLWAHVVRLVGLVDRALVDEIGIDRDPDHSTEVLFAAQEQLLERAAEERRPAMARIIPLFGDEPGATAAAG